MDKERKRIERHRKMVTGKVRKVGVIEKCFLKYAGKSDGKREFPRKTEKGNFTSPFMDREKNGFSEFSADIWGNLQMENESRFAELTKMANIVRRKKESLMEAMRQLDEARRFEEGRIDFSRKAGEDDLTEVQIRNRRRAEAGKRLGPLSARVTALKNEFKTEEENLFKLYTAILEDEITTRLICYRVKEHLLMRMDVYWDSAIRFHPEGSDMPVVPEMELSNEAEEEYMRQHSDLMEKVADMHENSQAINAKEVE